MNLRTLSVNALWSSIAHLLGRGSLVVAAILLARTLDTEGFATYSFFQLTVSMLAAYAAMGLGVTASRFFAESGHVDKASMPPIGTLWLLSILSALAFSVIVLILPSGWLDGGLGIPRWLLALGVFVTALGIVPGGGVLGIERYAAATLSAAAGAVVLIGGAVLAGLESSAMLAMVMFVVAALVQAVGNTAVIVRELGWRQLLFRTRPWREELVQIVDFAAPMLAVTLLVTSGVWLVGRAVLAGPAGERGFAMYAIGLQWYALVLFMPGMITRVLLPGVVRSRLKGSADSRVLVRRGAGAALLVALISGVLVMVLSPWLLALYGANYSEAEWLLVFFVLAAVPAAPINSIGNGIIAANGQRAWLLITLLWFVLLLAFALGFAEKGVLGAAWAYCLSSIGQLALAFRVARRRGLV